MHHFYLYTIYPRSLGPFYIITYYIKWVKTSWPCIMFRYLKAVGSLLSPCIFLSLAAMQVGYLFFFLFLILYPWFFSLICSVSLLSLTIFISFYMYHVFRSVYLFSCTKCPRSLDPVYIGNIEKFTIEILAKIIQ